MRCAFKIHEVTHTRAIRMQANRKHCALETLQLYRQLYSIHRTLCHARIRHCCADVRPSSHRIMRTSNRPLPNRMRIGARRSMAYRHFHLARCILLSINGSGLALLVWQDVPAHVCELRAKIRCQCQSHFHSYATKLTSIRYYAIDWIAKDKPLPFWRLQNVSCLGSFSLFRLHPRSKRRP